MQASRTAHYAWLYRGSRAPITSRSRMSQGSQIQSPTSAAAAVPLRSRVSPYPRTRPDGRDFPAEVSSIAGGGSAANVIAANTSTANANAAMARAHFIEAQIRDAVQSGIRQMVWLGPRASQPAQSSGFELGVEVEVFRLEEDTLRGTDTLRGNGQQGQGQERGARAVLDRSLVRSARTLFVCDGLLDRSPSAQIQAIFRTIGDSCYGSRLACLYLDRGLTNGNLASGSGPKPRRAVPRLGNPDDPAEPTEATRLGLEMRALPGLLACAGLVLDADVSLSEYGRRCERSARAAAGDLRSFGCWRLLVAHVRAPATATVTSATDAADSDVN